MSNDHTQVLNALLKNVASLNCFKCMILHAISLLFFLKIILFQIVWGPLNKSIQISCIQNNSISSIIIIKCGNHYQIC